MHSGHSANNCILLQFAPLHIQYKKDLSTGTDTNPSAELLSGESAGTAISLGWSCEDWLHAVVGFIPPLGLNTVCSHALYCYATSDNGSRLANAELASDNVMVHLSWILAAQLPQAVCGICGLADIGGVAFQRLTPCSTCWTCSSWLVLLRPCARRIFFDAGLAPTLYQLVQLPWGFSLIPGQLVASLLTQITAVMSVACCLCDLLAVACSCL